MYKEIDFVKIAKRENNTKRSFLIVNPLQGKHIPISPSKALKVFSSLSKILGREYENESVLIVGFAETATAIGSQIAIDLCCDYIQTTREIVDDSQYLFFSEEHSHATEQKLVRTNLDDKICSYDRIIFVDDEISTGKTILNIIFSLQNIYKKNFNYSVASILNGMNEENISVYNSKDIKLHYLVKSNPADYSIIANSINIKNDLDSYVAPHFSLTKKIQNYTINGLENPRKIINAKDYLSGCKELWEKIRDLKLFELGSNIEVIGTEEFMYPAMYVGKQLELMGNNVTFHATTRSPIEVSTTDSYPLHKRYELRSLYDNDRVTFIYDINPCDYVLIITDACSNQTEGINSLVNALLNYCNNITLISWSK